MIESVKRLVDKTFVTEDEQYRPDLELLRRFEEVLSAMEMDTYNKRYIVRITIDEVKE